MREKNKKTNIQSFTFIYEVSAETPNLIFQDIWFHSNYLTRKTTLCFQLLYYPFYLKQNKGGKKVKTELWKLLLVEILPKNSKGGKNFSENPDWLFLVISYRMFFKLLKLIVSTTKF